MVAKCRSIGCFVASRSPPKISLTYGDHKWERCRWDDKSSPKLGKTTHLRSLVRSLPARQQNGALWPWGAGSHLAATSTAWGSPPTPRAPRVAPVWALGPNHQTTTCGDDDVAIAQRTLAYGPEGHNDRESVHSLCHGDIPVTCVWA